MPDESEPVILSGVVENVIYQNSTNGYTVFELRPDADGDDELEELTCVATIPDLNPGEQLRLSGTYTMHALYGRQFQVTYTKKLCPSQPTG